MRLTFERKLLLGGTAATLIPLFIVGVVSWIYSQRSLQETSEHSASLAASDLQHVADGVYGQCASSRALLENAARTNLQVARHLLERAGGFRKISSWPVQWQAIDQTTQAAKSVTLPAGVAGANWLGQVTDAAKPVAVVDEMKRVTGSDCTILQRMNPEGDMIRIATTVLGKDGKRAIGTYIPHKLAGGAANPVIATTLAGNAFVGRAFVAGAWNVAAYLPLKDESGQVQSLLFVGIPERDATRQVEQLVAGTRVGETGGVLLFHRQGDLRNRPVSQNTDAAMTAQVLTAWESAGSSGDGGNARLVRVAWRDGSGRDTTARVAVRYFEPWDWMIAVAMPEAELLRASNEIAQLIRQSQWISALVVFLALGLSLVAWSWLARRWTGRIHAITSELNSASAQLQNASSEVAGSSQHLADSANRQSAAMQQVGAAIQALGRNGQAGAVRSGEMRGAVCDAVASIKSASGSMSRLDQSMQAITRSGKAVSKVLDSINEIALQTNLLALNAAVEAARAGEAGLGFAVVADGVRALAGRCANASRETAELISESQTSVREGGSLAAATTASLSSIEAAATVLDKLSAEVASDSAGQSEAARQIQAALEDVGRSTQQAAAFSEESAAAAEQLRAQATVLARSANELDDLFFAGAGSSGPGRI